MTPECKPIAVLYIPNDDYFLALSASDATAAFNGYHDKIRMPESFDSYLWFVFVDSDLNAPKLEVFHEKDFTEIQYADLMALVEQGIKQTNPR